MKKAMPNPRPAELRRRGAARAEGTATSQEGRKARRQETSSELVPRLSPVYTSRLMKKIRSYCHSEEVASATDEESRRYSVFRARFLSVGSLRPRSRFDSAQRP